VNRRDWIHAAALGLGAGGLSLLENRPLHAQGAVEAAQGGTPPLTVTNVRAILTAPRGIRLVVVKVTTSEPVLYGLATYSARVPRSEEDDRHKSLVGQPHYWEPGPYVRTIPRLFEHLRKQLGDDVELLHDVHERVPPGLGIDLDEKLAARFPIRDDPPFDLKWGDLRRRDGTIAKP